MNRIIKISRPNRRQARALRALIAECNLHDGTHYSLPEDADRLYLLYVGTELAAAAALFLMGEEREGRAIYELAAYTAPNHRRRKYFEQLLSAFREKIKGQYIKYAIYDNTAARAVLHHRGAIHDHDELLMRLTLPHGYDTDATSPSSGDIHIDYETGHAYSDFGECWFRLNADGSEAYIFGVQTYANHLRQGHAYKLLSHLYAELATRKVKNILLQVSSDNTPALKLYEKLGMSIQERLELYYELF